MQGHGQALGLHFWGKPWQFSVVSAAREVADWGWARRACCALSLWETRRLIISVSESGAGGWSGPLCSSGTVRI